MDINSGLDSWGTAVLRWELVSGGSAKFWEVGQDGTTVTVRFGRLGTAGQTLNDRNIQNAQ